MKGCRLSAILLLLTLLVAMTSCIYELKEPLTVSIISPLNNAHVSGNIEVVLSVKSTYGIYKLELYIGENKIIERTGEPYSFSLNTKDYVDGIHTLKVRASDIKGNTNESSIEIIIDNTPPIVEIISPLDNTIVRETIRISAYAMDGTGISKVEFYINDSKISEITTAPYVIDIDTTKYPEGQYTLKSIAYDLAGNHSEVSINIKIENTFPIVQITFPNHLAYVSGITDVVVYASHSSGVNKVELYINDSKISEQISLSDSDYIFKFNLDTRTYPDGQYSLKAIAYNNIGNSKGKSISITIDNTYPTVEITSPNHNEYATGTINVNVTATDTSGIMRVELYVNDFKISENTQSHCTFVVDTTKYVDGQYTLKALAYDRAQNKDSAQILLNFANSGLLSWKFQTSSFIYTCPAVDKNGTIYLGSLDGTLYALTSQGELKWYYKTAGNNPYSSPAIGNDGTIYVGSSDNALYAITPTGTLLWRFYTSGDITSSPAIGNDGTIDSVNL